MVSKRSRVVAVRLPNEQADALDALAEARQVRPSAVVREMVAERLSDPEIVTELALLQAAAAEEAAG